MQRILWNENWKVRRENGKNGEYSEETKAVLPHDGMIETARSKEAWNGTKKAFFENGIWEYRKEFEVKEKWRGKKIFVEFEGVYRNALIFVNGRYAGKHAYGYTEFAVDITDFLNWEGKNEIKVKAESDDDSRWYSGAGIYRNVNLLVADEIHIENNGIQISVPVAERDMAQIIIETQVKNEQTGTARTVRVVSQILDDTGKAVAGENSVLTIKSGGEGKVRQRITIEKPRLWDTEEPALYFCITKLFCGEILLDETKERFGIRKIGIDAKRGFTLNGKTVALRGTCIHHDNGIIGARTFYAAEYRRVKKLKEAGFNAIRMAHHPAGRALLDACDELGMLVMDESFDMWKKPKSSHDYALDFEENWEADVEAMIRKDYNHPCVVIYSVGNEIPDLEQPQDAITGRQIAEKIRLLDASRFTTNAINGILLIMNNPSVSEALTGNGVTDAEEKAGGKHKELEINETMASMEEMIRMAINMPFLDEAIEEACNQVDIAGYNYMADRYEADLLKYPNRIIVGSETYPKDICRNWRWVKKLPNVIGDFTWTGWDYLGETGVGKVTYDEEMNAFNGFYGDYPYITAGCGDIDITGYRRPVSFYREIIFGLRKEPYIAVSRPEMSGRKMNVSVWGWSDVVSSWSFGGYEGTKVKAEVYADADAVELFINGKSQGRKIITDADECKAIFDVCYDPGVIEAVAYVKGKETGRYQVRSAEKEKLLRLQAEASTVSLKKQDLIFLNLVMTDENGIPLPMENPLVELSVEGAGILLGFGSGAPKTEESYTDLTHTLYDGRGFAVVLPTECGVVTIRAKTKQQESELTIEVKN